MDRRHTNSGGDPPRVLDQIVVLIVNVGRNQANPLHATTTKLSPGSVLACYVQHEKPINQQPL